MSTFAYIARDAVGGRVTGEVAAASEQAVLSELHARQLSPVQIKKKRDRRRSSRGVPVRQLAGAYRQMADLLRAGVPLLRALRLLGRSKSNPRLAEVMSSVADAVSEGTRLADAMAVHGEVFPPVQLAMVRAGERGGFLESVLGRMGTFLEAQADVRAKVLGNMIYPIVLVVISVGVVVAALVFFVPQFETFYATGDVPLPTKIVLGASAALTKYWMVTVLGLVALVVAILWARRRPDVQRAFAVGQLKTPKVGPLIANMAVARFSRMLGTLLENGVPLLAAMQIARDAAGHVLLVEAIDEASEAVRSGETLAEPLARSGMFAEDVLEIIAVGESANNLPEVLTGIADTIEKRVDRMLNVILRLMEPMMLMMLGGMVLFIFVALIVPMMRMGTSLQ